MLNQFLFTVEFHDGTVYHQNEKDKSIFGGINCFSDVKDKKIKKFIMHGCGHVYVWDFIFGSLTIDNSPPIWPPVEIYPGMPIKPIYYRITQQKLKQTFEVQKHKGILGMFNVENKISTDCAGYVVGYEFPRNGKNVQWTVKIQVENK